MTARHLGRAMTRALAAMLTVLLVVVGIPTPAMAADGSNADTQSTDVVAAVSSADSLPVGFQSYSDGALQAALSSNPTVLTPDTEYEVVLQWNLQEIQASGVGFPEYLDFGLDLGDNIDIDFASFPTSLLAVSGIQDLGNGTVRVSFHPDAATLMGSTPIETLSLKFQLTTHEEGVEASHINWRGKGGESQILLVPGDATLITGSNSLQKTPGAPTLTGVNAGRTSATFNDATLNVTVPYTVTASTTAGGEMVITDAFRAPENAWLEYPAASGFTVELTTWIDLGEGYGKQSTRTLSASEVADAIVVAADGKSFTFTEEVLANSTAKISYTASLTDDSLGIQAFKDDYVTRYNAADEGAMVYVPVRNDAERTVGTSTLTTGTTAQVGIRKYQPNRPGIGTGDFSKDVNITALRFRDFDGLMNARTMETPVELTYKIHASLGKFDPTSSSVGEDENGDRDERFFTLTEDVLIKDTAPVGGEWIKAAGTPAGDPGPLDISSSPALTYKAATGTLNTDALLRAFLAPGEYTVIGKQLVANIGQNNASNWEITPKILVDAAGMTPNINSTTGYGYYTYRNTAQMAWVTQGGGSSFNDSADTTFTDRRDDDEREVTDPSVFDKTVGSSLVSTTPGQPAEVDYQITVRGGTANDDQIDLSQTDVVDHVDRNIFDLGDYNTGTKQFNNVELTARYTVGPTIRNYTASDFELAWDDTEGGLRITPTAATTADIDSARGSSTSDRIVFNLKLRTFPIEGRQILRITNSASYLGESSIEGNYRTSITSAGSSLGSAMTLVKAAYDEENDKFSTGVRILPGSLDSATDNAEAVFRLSMLVPGNFNGRINLNDNLTNAGLVFQGFVDGPQGASPSTSQIWLGRNIVVRASGNVIEITTNGSSTTTQSDASVYEVFYRVTIPDWSEREDEPIINVAGTSSAVVTITDKYPLNITKVDSTALSKDITDPKARFAVLDEDNNVVVSGASVQNNKLVIRDGDEVKAVLVDTPGTYTVREDRAPDGYLRTADTIEVTVNTDGTSSEALFENAPAVTGEIALTKIVSGVMPASVGTAHDFVFDWAATPPSGVVLNGGDEEGEVTVKGGETVNLGINFPEGTVVTFTERATSQPLAEHLFVGVTPTTLTATVGKKNTQTVVATNTYAPMVSVGDYVWADTNRDGIQGDPEDEPGIRGVQLILRDSDGNQVTDVHGKTVGPVITDDKGKYGFVDLPALTGGKTYVVSIDQEAGTTKSALANYLPTTTSNPDRETNSSTGSARTEKDDLTEAGDKDLTLDFGFVRKTFAVGDLVWIDANGNGLQDAKELPLKDVTVTLLDWAGKAVTDAYGKTVAATTTDVDGRYLFDNLVTGTYKVQFTLTTEQSAQYVFTKNVTGRDSTDNSDGRPATAASATATTAPFTLDESNTALVDANTYTAQAFNATEGIDPTWDAGVHLKHVSVGDYVWFDLNRNGVQNSGEQGIAGIRLELVGPDGKSPVTTVFGDPVGPTWTDVDGNYRFANLPVLSGNDVYTVKIITTPKIEKSNGETVDNPIAELVPTREGGTPGEKTDRATDSSTNKAETLPGALKEHEASDVTLDFGFMARTYAVGDRVWIDANRNGLQDSGEKPLSGVTVTLWDEKGNEVRDILGNKVAAIKTDSFGRYLFDNLPTGEYRVQFTLSREHSDLYTFTSNESGTDSLDNSDGIVTEKNGHFAITNAFTLDEKTAALTNAYTDQKFAATQGIDPTWDAGVHLKKVSVGDYVWVDSSRDGIQNAGEAGIKNVKLTISLTDEHGEPLLDSKGNPLVITDVNGKTVGPQVTDVDGKYLFEDLPALRADQYYTVTIDRTDKNTQVALAPYGPTHEGRTDSSKDSSTWQAHASGENLRVDGASDLTLDFGFVQPTYAVGDIVWSDANRDGIQGSDELPLTGVTVALVDKNGNEVRDAFGNVVAPVKTDASGRYLFDSLVVGTYKVRFTLTPEQAARYTFTKQVSGTQSTDNSDAVALKNTGTSGVVGEGVAETAAFTLNASSKGLTRDYAAQKFVATQGIDPTWDAGVHLKMVTVGDLVWFDSNKNGLQDPFEKGIAGVKVTLTNQDGQQVTDVFGVPVEPQVTNRKGAYRFVGLPALLEGQQYIVTIDRRDADTKKALKDYVPTAPGQGSDPAYDSSSWYTFSEHEGLRADGGKDLTLDFEFVIDPALEALNAGLENVEGEDVTKTDSKSPQGPNDTAGADKTQESDKTELPATGFGGLPAGAAAALLLVAGLLLVAMRRRTT